MSTTSHLAAKPKQKNSRKAAVASKLVSKKSHKTPHGGSVKRVQLLKNDTLNVRVTPHIKELVHSAAQVTGRTVSDYVTTSLVRQAHEDLASPVVIAIAREHHAAFMAILTDLRPLGGPWKRAAAVAGTITSRN